MNAQLLNSSSQKGSLTTLSNAKGRIALTCLASLLVLAAHTLHGMAQKQTPSPIPPQRQLKKASETDAPAIDKAPILANICPKFVLIGTPRRIKFFGAYFLEPLIEYEEEDLEFRDYKVDPDGRAFTVTVEAKRQAQPGKRIFTLEGQADSSREAVIYVLKREDRALLQRDLIRCPEMKDEVEIADPKKPSRPALRPTRP